MIVEKKITQRFTKLIKKGNQVLKTAFKFPNGQYGVNATLVYELWINSLSLTAHIFGEESPHYKNLEKIDYLIDEYWAAEKVLGIIKAAKDDYNAGFLVSAKILIEASVFDEFLEQAEELLKKGYFLASAVIAGCVLEDCLRKLCKRNSIILPAKATIEPMNVELAKSGIYNKLWQKKITALADLRNKAAHNQGGFTKEDVEDMIRNVRRFMEDYFS